MNLDLKIPPMALMIFAMVIMKLLAEYFPIYHVEYTEHSILAAVILLCGVLVATLGVMAFKKSQTTMNPFLPAKATQLVITGIYNYSRNPMYLGFLLVLMSAIVHLESVSSIIILPLFVAYMNKFQIAPEEKALTRLFGEPYLVYTGKVRRWL